MVSLCLDTRLRFCDGIRMFRKYERQLIPQLRTLCDVFSGAFAVIPVIIGVAKPTLFVF